MPETEWMTLLQTADIMKKLPIQVTRMCEDGKLEYYMEDGRYFVSRESIDLFMQPGTGGFATSNRDPNGTPRRQYGRAPEESGPAPESATESETVNGRDDLDARGEEENANGRDDADARGEEENVNGRNELDTRGEEETVNGRNELDARGEEETANGRDDADASGEEENVDVAEEATGHDDETGEDRDVATMETAEQPGDAEEVTGHDDENVERPEAEGPDSFGGAAPTVGEEDEAARADEERAAAATDPGDPNARAVEILADLRAAITRHAVEHKAFCDEVAGLADALEGTLSQDGDKTSELTREISSLLARYTRR